MTDKQVRDIVKSMLRSEMLNVPNKAESKKIAKEEAEKAVRKAIKDVLTQKDVKQMIRKTIVAQYKYLWEKSNFFINQI